MQFNHTTPPEVINTLARVNALGHLTREESLAMKYMGYDHYFPTKVPKGEKWPHIPASQVWGYFADEEATSQQV